MSEECMQKIVGNVHHKYGVSEEFVCFDVSIVECLGTAIHPLNRFCALEFSDRVAVVERGQLIGDEEEIVDECGEG